jgi:hypothetical protein
VQREEQKGMAGMSLYTVTSIHLDAIPGVHNGTGTFQSSNWVIVPSSVPGSGKLQFQGEWVQVTTRLFAISDMVVPNWFGVAIPNGVQDFTRAHIFFHPMPGQAKYVDADYFTKGGPPGHEWTRLFYYMERLGYQLDGAARNQILIMPFLTNAATDTGIFAANWFDIITDILTALRAEFGADDGSPLAISQIAVSSFSVGIVYSHFFRLNAPHLDLMTEVWDFDGLYSTSASYSTQLVSTSQYQAIKYDQNPGAGAGSFHVPLPRWSDYVVPPKSGDDVHVLIRDFMFLHAASISNVGGTIAGGLGVGTVTTGGTHGTVGTGTTSATHGTAGTGTTAATGTTGVSGTTGGTGTTAGTGTTGTTGGTAATTGTAGTDTTGGTGTAPPTAPTPGPEPTAPFQKRPPLPPVAPRSPFTPAPRAPAPFAPQLPAPLFPAPTATPSARLPAPLPPPPQIHEACCCAAVTSMVAAVSTTATTAITCISAIAGIVGSSKKR